jgi:hypothetical protein
MTPVITRIQWLLSRINVEEKLLIDLTFGLALSDFLST